MGEGAEGIVGSWFGTVTATDPPLGQFNDLISFHGDGLVTESRRYFVTPTPFGPLLETAAHGAWRKTRSEEYVASFRFMLQNADTGEAMGTDEVRLAVTHEPADGTVTGTFQSQIRDTTGALLLTVTGSYSATPIGT